jgi:hypothetical protein
VTFDREIINKKNILLVYTITERGKRHVSNHFWAGRYSEFNEAYKRKWFKKNIISGDIWHPFKKHGVVWNSAKFRHLLADELGVRAEYIDELDSIPSFAQEVYGYKESKKKEKDRATLLIEEAHAYLTKIQEEKEKI